MKNMFYWISADISQKYKYAIKNLSFNGVTKDCCPQCNRLIAHIEYQTQIPRLVVEGGSLFPDCLSFCGIGERMLLLSQHAISVLEENGVEGISHCEPVEICEETNGNIRALSKNAPQYFNVILNGEIDVDHAAMHLKRKKYCTLCRQFEWNRQRLYPHIIDRNSWDGSDLCILLSFPGFKICTQKVVDIIQHNALTGFDFIKQSVSD